MSNLVKTRSLRFDDIPQAKSPPGEASRPRQDNVPSVCLACGPQLTTSLHYWFLCVRPEAHVSPALQVRLLSRWFCAKFDHFPLLVVNFADIVKLELALPHGR
jgi:hypothetical protein